MTWNALLCRAQSLDAFPLATSRKSVARRQTDLAGRHHLTAARVLVSSGFQSSTHCTTPLSRMGGERKKKEKMREKEPKKREFMYQKGPTPDFEAPVGGWRLLKLKRDVLNLFERRGKCLLICFHVRTCQWAPILYMASEY